MRQRRLFTIVIFSIAFLANLVLLTSCGNIPVTDSQSDPRANEQEQVDARAVAQFDASVRLPEGNATAITQETSTIDGRSILESSCSQCHLVESLLQVKKSRTDWEGALQQMEMMGVHLSDTEKVSLLDYLATAEAP